jgi:hypothetical protein
MKSGFPYAPLVLLFSFWAALACEGVAHAQHGGVDLKIDSIYERAEDPEQVAGLRDAQSAGLSVEAYGGTRDYFGAFIYVDAHFGGGYQGGFAYRFALLPVGITVHDKNHVVTLGVSGGLQLQGVTEHQAFGVQAPIRAAAIFNLGSHLHLHAWASNDFALGTDRREGSETALFGDEMQAGVSLRIGKGGKDGGHRSSVKYGSGYFVSGLFAERFGTRFWGIGIGHGMHMNGSGEP